MVYLETTPLLGAFQEVLHGTAHRCGGVSQTPYASLNVGENVNDSPSHVAENISRLSGYIGCGSIAKMDQVHGTTIRVVDEPGVYQCDGLITQQKELLLLIRHADCQPALFYDPTTKTIAAVHAGWKGLVAGIYPTVISALKQRGIAPCNLYVWIGPSLGVDHAEFMHYKVEFPKEYHRFATVKKHIDLKQIARAQLETAGVCSERIGLSPVCTFADQDAYYSYRRDGMTGRNGTFIALKQGANL